FHRVTGLDSSAALSFIRLLQAAHRDRFTVVASGGNDVVRSALRRARLDPVDEPRLRFEPDIEQGLTCCESALLADVAREVERADRRSLATLITHLLAGADGEIERLESYFRRIEFAAGDRLISEGAPSDDIFFIESGRASVIINGIES